MATMSWWLPWAVYVPLAAVGTATALFSRGSVLTGASEPWLSDDPWFAQVIGVVLAVSLAAVTIAVTRVLVRHTLWARELHVTLRGTLEGSSSARLGQVAILSAVSEELLFRSALVPLLGVAPSAALFGVMHVSPRGNRFAWALWAFVMGVAFGFLFEASGTVLAPMLAHALINYENMQYIINYDPTPLDTDRDRAPG